MSNFILNEEKKSEKKQGQDSLLDKLLATRQIVVSGEVNEELVEKIVKQLRYCYNYQFK